MRNTGGGGARGESDDFLIDGYVCRRACLGRYVRQIAAVFT